MEENTIMKRNVPRDLFLHLLAIVTLYWSAISFVTLLWQYINYFLPDVLNYYYQGTNYAIRFAVSSLVIVFPIFILVSWYLNNIYRREAQVRESKIRKWLIYLTLFITAIVMIGDLVTTINIFLGGEITSRFILKGLSILIVAGIIFWYYLDDVRRETPTGSAKYFAWATGIIVLASIIGSFFIIGSPATARSMQFDKQKIYDLQSIQGQIVNYWQRKQVLPNALSDLNDPLSSFAIPVDSETGKPYEYIVRDTTTLSFALCATFNKEGDYLDGISSPKLGVYSENWHHSAGRVCFERTIDKQLYPLMVPGK